MRISLIRMHRPMRVAILQCGIVGVKSMWTRHWASSTAIWSRTTTASCSRVFGYSGSLMSRTISSDRDPCRPPSALPKTRSGSRACSTSPAPGRWRRGAVWWIVGFGFSIRTAPANHTNRTKRPAGLRLTGQTDKKKRVNTFVILGDGLARMVTQYPWGGLGVLMVVGRHAECRSGRRVQGGLFPL